ncbi:MAG: protein kinase [Candidatus Krumholzibacteriota bacterium]|nr:protein kinase [Candidatus Krumholzibacteriota bacterium]
MIGETLAHYEITSQLGVGGMGEVYLARDTKLGRDVAIKVLPKPVSGDPERLARFDREARTLATLQHANIASIYGFESAGDVRFLVMELVDGEDLSDRLQSGAIPIDEAIDLAVQLAEGMAAAHTVGIIHRDLKPANLKITPEGKLKILDFGLARAYADDQASDLDLENSPTITAAMTQAGVILGTAAYMSPEQARGKRVDHRSDIWSFGVVLLEMLTGSRVFEGETVSDTLAGVLRAELPWDQLPKHTPPTLRRLLSRCLERDPSRRLQAIAEARIALEDLKAGRSDESDVHTPTPSRSSFGRERLVWIVVVAGMIAGLAAMTLLRSGTREQLLTLSTLLPPDGWDFAPASPFAVSPDGRRVAFVAIARPDNEEAASGTTSLWVRALDEAEPRHLSSEGGEQYPFWSPDGRWLGFFADDKLNKIDARGGPIISLCATSDGRGGTWNEAGTIVFQRAWSEGLMKIAAGGGEPEALTTLNKDRFDVAHRWPQFLPDGRHFLFYLVSTTNTVASEYSGIYIGTLDSDETRLLLKSESRALHAQGHLLYRVGSTLMARPFDANALEFKGDPIPVATDIPGGAISWGGAHFGVSEAGVLVHLRGAGATSSLLRWRDRDGNDLRTLGDAAGYWEPSLSNDGTRVAFSLGDAAGDIWIHDLERDVRTRFTFHPADDRTPLWSPDDSKLAFCTSRESAGEIFVRPTSGRGDAELLFTSDSRTSLSDWSNDGRFVLFDYLTLGDDAWDVWILDMETSEAKPLLSGRFNQIDGSLSADGKWIAFSSEESGAFEVYVQAFPEPQGRWMVSSGGGTQPAWGMDGRELYYLSAGSIVSIAVDAGENFSFGAPEVLFSVNLKASQSVGYRVKDDGQRFLTNELPPFDPSKIGARLIQNWIATLTR